MRDHKQLVIPILMEAEGCVHHYYGDHKGNVTYGVGHLVTQEEAEAEGLLEDWQACREHYRKHPGGPAISYETAAIYRFTKEAIMDRLQRDIQETHRQLVHTVDGYAQTSIGLAFMALELGFHIGVTKLKRTYPRFQAALRLGDWKRGLQEIDRGTAHKHRVAMVRGAVYMLEA